MLHTQPAINDVLLAFISIYVGHVTSLHQSVDSRYGDGLFTQYTTSPDQIYQVRIEIPPASVIPCVTMGTLTVVVDSRFEEDRRY